MEDGRTNASVLLPGAVNVNVPSASATTTGVFLHARRDAALGACFRAALLLLHACKWLINERLLLIITITITIVSIVVGIAGKLEHLLLAAIAECSTGWSTSLWSLAARVSSSSSVNTLIISSTSSMASLLLILTKLMLVHTCAHCI